MTRQLLAFALTGATAALVHLLVVVGLVEALALAPLRANAGGFLVAFGVSYAGHRHVTFACTACPHRHGLPRFFIVAVTGFLVNELLFAACLRQGLPYPLALAGVLLLVAALTFVLSRYWAFAGGGRLLSSQTRSKLPQK